MATKLERMSNAPLELWPLALLRTQIVLIHKKLFELPLMDLLEISQAYNKEEAITFINANKDLIEERR